ncbi:MAG: class IV adenylate cyclase [Nevskia sp.]
MRNLEAKFKIRDPSAAQIAAIAIGYKPAGLLSQHDTFFKVARGKLKLREEDERAYLVAYQRADEGALQLSEYRIVPVPDPAAMRKLLSGSLGVLAEVRKRRTLLRRDHVRLHLDEIEGLGFYGEIEAVLDDDADLDGERAFVERTLLALQIERAALIEDSYFELMQSRGAGDALP